ncbi:MAG: hypothetical protein HQL72_09040 [Magnetococcales bacterium]|nr:hypothetical protein [Magnetococcales bacterium]
MGFFWNYFTRSLQFLLIQQPGPLSQMARGGAESLDGVRDDMLWLRDQFLPVKADPAFLTHFANARGIKRIPGEDDGQFAARTINAYAWYRLGGREKGLNQFFTVFGFEGAVIEPLIVGGPGGQYDFQIHLPPRERGYEESDFETLIHLTNEQKPARSRLARITAGCHTPHLVLDQGGFGDYLSDYSGVMVNGVVMSLCRTVKSHAERSLTQPHFIHDSYRSLHTVYRDRFILDHSYFGEKSLPNNPMTHSVLRGFVAGSLAPPPILKNRTISRAQAVLSGGDPLGSLNERLSPRIRVEIGGPTILSESLLSEEIHRFEWQPVDIYPERIHPVAVDAKQESVVHQVRDVVRGVSHRRRYWPVLSDRAADRPIHKSRQVTRGKSAAYDKQPWLDAYWPAGKTWNTLNTITGKNHVRTH